jgi:uroporphyrinogen-III decarboxylase
MVLNYNMREVEKTLANKPKIVHFGDDLGNQTSLPMSPEHFRKYLKPCYKKIFGACRDAGAHVYLHSDGHILEIIDDLIECGVTVLNPQIRANTLDGLVEKCKGKVAVNLDLDRQLFPFCTPEEIDEHVREAVVKLGSKEGGLMLTAECEPDVPLENIEAICQALEKYRLFDWENL